MKVTRLLAEPHPSGGRIDLSWVNPPDSNLRGVVILRSESDYPDTTLPEGDGKIEIHRIDPTSPGEAEHFSDVQGLKAETVYYYAVAAYDSLFNYDPAMTSALSIGTYQTAERLYEQLPGLYRRYDSVKPPDVQGLDPGMLDKGQLRRFLDLFGLQFDLIRGFATGMRNFSDRNRIPGELLPLLAQWIGWESDFTQSLIKQRNDVAFAPHYYRTLGVAANLRALINRMTSWDVKFKEYAHTIFRSNDPEQLLLYEKERQGANWKGAAFVSLDAAYDGRPVVVKEPASDRLWLFYHAKQSASGPEGTTGQEDERWQIRYKVCDRGQWLPSRCITVEGGKNRYPAAARRVDGGFWIFWTQLVETGGRSIPQIRTSVISAGLPARPARIRGTKAGPFAFDDGGRLTVSINGQSRTVIFRSEQFFDIAAVSVQEVASVLNSELPGVQCSAEEDGMLQIVTENRGAAASLSVDTGAAGLALGISGNTASGADATRAQLIASGTPTAYVVAGKRLVLRVDGSPPRAVTFAGDCTSQQAVDEVNKQFPGCAESDGESFKLVSPTDGEKSFLAIDVDASTAASEFGFLSPVPAALSPAHDAEPSLVEGPDGNLWLFWSSRRGAAGWKIWLSVFDPSKRAWSTPGPVTEGPDPDRQPAALFYGSKIWLFWSRRKAGGRWNIFLKTSNGDPLAWSNETELAAGLTEPVDRQEACPSPLPGGGIELFFSSNRTAGWNLWRTILPGSGPYAEEMITTGQYTQRAAAAAATTDGVRLLYRSNETRVMTSTLYPAAETRDERFSGSTTVDARNKIKNSLRGNVEDIQHCTYDTGRVEDVDAQGRSHTGEHPYSRGTIGIFLSPGTDDEALITQKANQIRSVIKRFLPIQVRPLFFIQRGSTEYVYDYERTVAPQRLIGEQEIETIIGEAYRQTTEAVEAHLDGCRLISTWEKDGAASTIASLNEPGKPKDTSSRLFSKGLTEGV